jgi:hypothetical protein
MSAEHLILKTPTARVSTEAAYFARQHGLWGSLVALKNLIMLDASLVATVNVDLVSDPEVTGRFTICFSVRTSGSLSDVLDFDDRVRAFMCQSVPAEDQIYFAMRFDLT